uniref:Uncharacterized protein n=1 Tax=Anguilla anguilla TaxID=7936 RepID=A0A0E9UNP9_ANGAN
MSLKSEVMINTFIYQLCNILQHCLSYINCYDLLF